MIEEVQKLGGRSAIYKLYWENNPNVYIGQSVDVYKRHRRHVRELERGVHPNDRLNNCYKKYGTPFLEVLSFCNKEELDSQEQQYLDIFYGQENCCNICSTASSTKGYKHTEESKRIIGILSKKKIFTEEYRAKLRARPVNITMLGKTHTEETKKLMSDARKGVPKSEEFKKKVKEANLKTFRKNAIPIIDINTGIKYTSVKSASRDLEIHEDTLRWRIKYFKDYHIVNT